MVPVTQTVTKQLTQSPTAGFETTQTQQTPNALYPRNYSLLKFSSGAYNSSTQTAVGTVSNAGILRQWVSSAQLHTGSLTTDGKFRLSIERSGINIFVIEFYLGDVNQGIALCGSPNIVLLAGDIIYTTQAGNWNSLMNHFVAITVEEFRS